MSTSLAIRQGSPNPSDNLIIQPESFNNEAPPLSVEDQKAQGCWNKHYLWIVPVAVTGAAAITFGAILISAVELVIGLWMLAGIICSIALVVIGAAYLISWAITRCTQPPIDAVEHELQESIQNEVDSELETLAMRQESITTTNPLSQPIPDLVDPTAKKNELTIIQTSEPPKKTEEEKLYDVLSDTLKNPGSGEPTKNSVFVIPSTPHSAQKPTKSDPEIGQTSKSAPPTIRKKAPKEWRASGVFRLEQQLEAEKKAKEEEAKSKNPKKPIERRPSFVTKAEKRLSDLRVETAQYVALNEMEETIKVITNGCASSLKTPPDDAQRKALSDKIKGVITLFNDKRIVPPVLTDPKKELPALLNNSASLKIAEEKLDKLIREASHYERKYSSQAIKMDQEIEKQLEAKPKPSIQVETNILEVNPKEVTSYAKSEDYFIRKYSLQEGSAIQKALATETQLATHKIGSLVHDATISGIVCIPTLSTNTHSYLLVKCFRSKNEFELRKFEKVKTLQSRFYVFAVPKGSLDKCKKLLTGDYQYWKLDTQRIFAVPFDSQQPCLCLNATRETLIGKDTIELAAIREEIEKQKNAK